MAKLFSRITAAAAALCAALMGFGCNGGNDPSGNEPIDVYGPPEPDIYEAVYGPPEWFGQESDNTTPEPDIPEPIYGPPEAFDGEQAVPAGN